MATLMPAGDPGPERPPWEEAPAPLPERKRYRSGQEVFEATPAEIEWCWHGYAAPGVITLLAGRHKGGKSTLLFNLLAAMCDGDTTFLGHALVPGPVVLLTEEGDQSLRPKLEIISEEGRANLRVLGRADVTPRTDYDWARAVREAGLEALEHGARMVLIDTFAFWAEVSNENDNALMQSVVSVLGELSVQGLSVVIVHHARKDGGEEGNAIRGASSLQGAVDIIVEMVKPHAGEEEDTNDRGTERELRAVGRFPESPEAMRVKLVEGRYVLVGEGTRAAMRNLDFEAKVRDYLSEHFADTHDLATIQKETGLRRESTRKALGKLEAAGYVESFTGPRGKKSWRWVIGGPPPEDDTDRWEAMADG